MDATRVTMLREVLTGTGWVERAGAFVRGLSRSTRHPGGLLLVGTPEHEPWHLAAHLDDESRWNDLPELAPTLVRWNPPAGAPAHLRTGMGRIEATRRGETLLVVAPRAASPALLARAADARKAGATVFALDSGDRGLEGVAHESLAVRPGGQISFDTVAHLVSSGAGDSPSRGRRGTRARLARLLDTVTGPGVSG